MATYFLYTSAVLKRYVLETGTAWVQALAAPAARHSLFVVRITLAKAVAAITRRERGGLITPPDAATAVADFQLDFAHQYRVVEVSAGLVAQAATLARRHALRGYDAVQLAAVLEIHANDPSLTLVSADAELNAAAQAEGLSVEGPELAPLIQPTTGYIHSECWTINSIACIASWQSVATFLQRGRARFGIRKRCRCGNHRLDRPATDSTLRGDSGRALIRRRSSCDRLSQEAAPWCRSPSSWWGSASRGMPSIGPQARRAVNPFQVDDITGPNKGTSLCYR